MNLTEIGYAAAWRVVRTMPRPLAAAAFRAGAEYAYRRGGKGTARLAANLRTVVGPDLPQPEFDRLLRRALRSYARYWLEMFRLPSLSREQIVGGFRLERGDLLGEDVVAGRGAVVALPHAGNWDAAGAWVAAMGWPITTVAERLKPEGVYEQFLAFRQSLGMEIIPLTGGHQPPLDVLADRIGQAHIVPLLADRDLSARGVDVAFFGGRTRMPAGPALLALRTGAPLYVVSMWYDDVPRGRLEGPLEVPDPQSGPLDQRVRALTQQIADCLAAGIAQHPEDWHMLQRMWLDAPRSSTAPQGSRKRSGHADSPREHGAAGECGGGARRESGPAATGGGGVRVGPGPAGECGGGASAGAPSGQS
jgi:lauroyl/myristoyl acyltransferase